MHDHTVEPPNNGQVSERGVSVIRRCPILGGFTTQCYPNVFSIGMYRDNNDLQNSKRLASIQLIVYFESSSCIKCDTSLSLHVQEW